jgi:hypothetical protein
MWSSSNSSPASHHSQTRVRPPPVLATMQPLPKIVVFRCHQMPPAPRLQVRIRSDTDIGPVHMRVRSVGVDQVCQSKPLRHRSVVFDEGVYIDYAGDRTITILGQGELLNQPICWYLAIGICVRQPTALARSFVASRAISAARAREVPTQPAFVSITTPLR